MRHRGVRSERLLHRALPVDPDDLASSAAAIVEAWRDALILTLHPTRPVADVQALYAELLPKIGTPHYLAEDARIESREAQRTGELWFEVRYDPAIRDSYRNSANAQPLHTDGSYIASFPNATLMCCVTNAAEGGETVFIAAEALIDALRAEEPELLARLERTVVPHARSGDRREYPVIRREGGEPRLNWNYYCVAADVTPEVRDLRERLFAFLRDSPGVRRAIHPIKLAPGDGVVWKDERLLHGRNAFVASSVGERFLWKCAIDVGVL